jgi:hypothetical protein
MAKKDFFSTILKFIRDAGARGVTSVLAALVALIISLYEHAHDRPISAYALVVVSVVLFWLGAGFAWNKKRQELEKEISRRERPKLFLIYTPVEAPYILTHSGLCLKNDGSTAYNVEFKPEVRKDFSLILDNPTSPVEKGSPRAICVRFCRMDATGRNIPMEGMPSMQIESLMEELSERGVNSFSVGIICTDFERNSFESCSQINYDTRSKRISVSLCSVPVSNS